MKNVVIAYDEIIKLCRSFIDLNAFLLLRL